LAGGGADGVAVFGGSPVVALGGSLLMEQMHHLKAKFPFGLVSGSHSELVAYNSKAGESSDLITDGPENSKPPFGFPEIQVRVWIWGV